MFSIWSTNFNSCSAFSWRTKTLSPHSCSTEVTNFSSQAALQGTRSGHGTHSTVHSVARCVTRVLRGAIVDPRRTSVIKEDEVVSRVNHNNMIFLIQMIVCYTDLTSIASYDVVFDASIFRYLRGEDFQDLSLPWTFRECVECDKWNAFIAPLQVPQVSLQQQTLKWTWHKKLFSPSFTRQDGMIIFRLCESNLRSATY